MDYTLDVTCTCMTGHEYNIKYSICFISLTMTILAAMIGLKKCYHTEFYSVISYRFRCLGQVHCVCRLSRRPLAPLSFCSIVPDPADQIVTAPLSGCSRYPADRNTILMTGQWSCGNLALTQTLTDWLDIYDCRWGQWDWTTGVCSGGYHSESDY